MSFLLILLAMFQSSDLVDAVNSERGGRHWIDQKPEPPKSPQEEQAAFQTEPGCRIELVAAEPLVLDPVWIDFDHLGRMFVAEYGDYPIGPVNHDGTENKDAAPLSRIVLLEDTDDDGRMDKRTVFADKLKFCHSFMPLMDGILAGAQTEILFLKDTDGDNVADVREVWYDGFTPAHPQMQIGCPRWGMDNWIYLTYAPGNVRCRRPGFETTESVRMPRQDMRFDPLTMKFESVSGLGQFGNTIDNDGNRFFCTNRHPIMMEMIPQWATKVNPLVSVSKRHTDVGPSGGDTKVFPLVAMKSNWLSHAGTHTSACGVTAYRGDLWDDSFQHSVFACEPVGHLVTRSIVSTQPDSPALTARRARPKADFIASGDTWFRPASLRTGPNGGLYLADMYRMWVEHPKFLPPEIAARIDWRAGEDRGRIWRIVPTKNAEPRRKFKPLTSNSQIAISLNDSNGWRRSTALRLATERQLNLTREDFGPLAQSHSDPLSIELHAALFSARGDGKTALTILTSSTAPVSMAVNRWISRIMANRSLRFGQIVKPDGNEIPDFLRKQLGIHAVNLDSVASRDPIMRLQHVLLAARSEGEVAESLSKIVKAGPLDHWLGQAILLASKECSGQILAAIAARDDAAKHSELIQSLAAAAGQHGNPAEVATALKAAAEEAADKPGAQTAILTGLSRGLPRHNGSLKARSLSALLADPPASASDAVPAIRTLLTSAENCANDDQRTAEERIAAVRLLSTQSAQHTVRTVVRLLDPANPATVQVAALDAVRGSTDPDIASALFNNWKGLAPSVRSHAITFLLARPNTTSILLQAMTSGTVSSSVIDIDQRLRLLQHRDASIKSMAMKIFGGVVSADRKAVADEYKAAITMKASAERGAAVFKKTCIKCHKIDGEGANVGPDISDTRNRSRDALLYDILDPNRRVDPQFTEYIVLLKDGRSLSGLLVSDLQQQIVLRQPEGKERTIQRSDIEELQATVRSLMPVGIEKDVSVQQMADLLEFLKAR